MFISNYAIKCLETNRLFILSHIHRDFLKRINHMLTLWVQQYKKRYTCFIIIFHNIVYCFVRNNGKTGTVFISSRTQRVKYFGLFCFIRHESNWSGKMIILYLFLLPNRIEKDRRENVFDISRELNMTERKRNKPVIHVMNIHQKDYQSHRVSSIDVEKRKDR